MSLKDVLNSKHMPTQSEIAGGLAGIAAGLLSSYLGLDAQTSMAIVGAAMALIIRIVPDRVEVAAKKVDDIVKNNSAAISDVLAKAKSTEVLPK